MRCGRLSLIVTLVVLFSASQSVYASSILYGSLSGPTTSGALAGSIVTIDPTTGVGVVLGVPIAGTGITGLAIDSSGRLIGATSEDGGAPRLIEIDPLTGGLVSVIASLTFDGLPQAVTDLTFDPTTNTLYANGAFSGPKGTNNSLLTVDMSTGATTLVGGIPSEGGFKALGSSVGGTLYSISTFGTSLHSLDPTDASILSSVGLGPAAGIGALGMAVRPSDGMVFFTNGASPFGRSLYMVDPFSEVTSLVGLIGLAGNVHDLVFLEETAAPVPEPVTILLVGSGAAALAVRRRMSRRRPA